METESKRGTQSGVGSQRVTESTDCPPAIGQGDFGMKTAAEHEVDAHAIGAIRLQNIHCQSHSCIAT